ncbi:related to 5',5'''-P-1,P-4-tetraphosphate phosphorylase 2 [Cephalotrichum gorgonifer]|uniref:Related to 5',5'''-P-1,P-4-tetraphosphate phosphorylase 2 n=1 Tax=Cephalotrichum gorgonifer TaxID=2041049 RepID=A0AAE8STG8_9PEZI|nr:related to 5',5'''-P-1,P-4-tetraphosphate phosphorylase 2 [Cephalotrichum gorgonifer]
MTVGKVPDHLPQLVRASFNKARANGDLLYFQTQVTILAPGSIPFQLRFSPALAKKPTKPAPATPAPSGAKRVFNPFENIDPELLIAKLPSHNLVLNKFAIVPEHFLLVTSSFHPQTDLLEGSDLTATYACIDAYHSYCERGEEESRVGEGELFAFFNSGEFSGASQPHRHIQLLPVARMRDGIEGGEWDVLAKRLVGEVEDLPFTTFAEEIRPGMSAHELRGIYLRLYRRACSAVAKFTGREEIAGRAAGQVGGEAGISYNLAMTRHALIVCPRLAEGAPVWDGGEVVGHLALNGTVLAGTALVKDAAEWDALRNDPEELLQALRTIGLPKRYEEKVLQNGNGVRGPE